MGKAQSREGPREAYLVHTVPAGYDITGRRANVNGKNVVVYKQTPQTFSRAQSLYSIPASEATTMASRTWRPGMNRKDIVDRKASYLGRFQTQALTETAMANLRTVLQRSTLKKTKIKLSPVGLSFGTKTTGVLQPDKVAYRFFNIEDIEAVRMDTINTDVILCITKSNDEHAVIHNGQTAIVQTTNFEINSFYINPKDGKILEGAALDFKSRHLQGGEIPWRSRSISIPPTDSVDHPRGLGAPYTPESRGWILTNGRNTQTLDRRTDKAYTVDYGRTIERKPNRYSVTEGTVPQSPSYMYNGTLPRDKTLTRKPEKRSVGVSANFPGSFGPVHPPSVHSLTTRVYFYKEDGPALADVECQVKPTTVSRPNSKENTSISSVEMSSVQRSSKSSSKSGSKSRGKKESVKRRIQDLSKEMDKLKSMLDYTDEDSSGAIVATQVEENSTSNGEVHYQTNGSTRKSVTSKHGAHAGTIDTRAGMVDVIVNQSPPKAKKTSHQVKQTTINSEVKRTHQHNGYVQRGSNTLGNPRTRPAKETNGTRENGRTTPNGRVMYYRPISPETAHVLRPENHSRARSTEPPKAAKGKSSGKWVYQ